MLFARRPERLGQQIGVWSDQVQGRRVHVDTGLLDRVTHQVFRRDFLQTHVIGPSGPSYTEPHPDGKFLMNDQTASLRQRRRVFWRANPVRRRGGYS